MYVNFTPPKMAKNKDLTVCSFWLSVARCHNATATCIMACRRWAALFSNHVQTDANKTHCLHHNFRHLRIFNTVIIFIKSGEHYSLISMDDTFSTVMVLKSAIIYFFTQWMWKWVMMISCKNKRICMTKSFQWSYNVTYIQQREWKPWK